MTKNNVFLMLRLFTLEKFYGDKLTKYMNNSSLKSFTSVILTNPHIHILVCKSVGN